jgi:hypothetical protein
VRLVRHGQHGSLFWPQIKLVFEMCGKKKKQADVFPKLRLGWKRMAIKAAIIFHN